MSQKIFNTNCTYCNGWSDATVMAVKTIGGEGDFTAHCPYCDAKLTVKFDLTNNREEIKLSITDRPMVKMFFNI